MNLAPIAYDSLQPIEIPVRIGPRNFILREADEGTTTDYQNMLFKGTTMIAGEDGEAKFSKVEGIADMEPFLVSRCLFEIKEEGKPPTPVTVREVRSWPSRIVKELHKRAMEISNLDKKKESEEEVKNSPNATEDTSS